MFLLCIAYDMRNSYSSHSPPVQSVAGANRPLAKQPSFTPNDGARARTSSRPLHRYHTQDIRGDQHETRGAGSMRSPSSNPNFSYHRDQPSPMLGESDEFNEDNEYSDDDYGDDYPPGDFDMWDLPPWLSELDDSTPARTEAQALKEYEDLRRAEEIKMMEEKVKQTKEEVMKKAAEAERMAEEVRIREEETRKKEMEMKQKEEELQRREKELEQRELEERKRREQEAKQKEEERKREEEERRRKEREAKEKENERKLDEELKRRAEAAETSRLQEKARMEGFRKEQDEVRRRTEDRKRQDSMGSSSSARYSQTSASSRTSSTPTPTPTPSTKPGAWKSANPSQSGATPSSGTSTTPTDHETQSAKERAWARRQAEFAKEQQEKFLRDQERQQRLHATQESKTMSKEEVEKLFAEHERQWNKVATMDMISWNIIPWPTFKYPNGPEDLTRPAISAYVLSPLYPTDRSKTEKDRVKEQIRRWHPDRFDTRMLPKMYFHDCKTRLTRTFIPTPAL
ncbi:hypothetical protein A0H81_02299 [Grifola frondosa]|uniref:Uncharacterized protein n=1 Tax=Grifola frondosa TaxID=5627 RepID=A0A1C7ML67_GRIFR|nr:hypothetical protein A0H81_02299 [Grifola frondosa]